jgi:thiamine kinase-like enzyme
MPDQRTHWTDVQAYLTKNIATCAWTATHPSGSGHETYVAHGLGESYFVKLGACAERYEILAADGLTPVVLSSGSLEDGTAIIVQPFIAGRKPSRKDFQSHLDRFAIITHGVHHHPQLGRILPPAPTTTHRAAAERALTALRRQWASYRSFVPTEATFVDDSLERLVHDIGRLDGTGLVASHNDICNANWIMAEDGAIYLVALEAMALDDPARDIGALLWWYYPPELRQHFLSIVGYADDANFRLRMQVRMALHCLQIISPRDNSFDRFLPASFGAALTDFRAVLAGEENPQGYG